MTGARDTSWQRLADVALRVVAAALLVSLSIAAWHDVSKAWDVWYYHLPFAARIVGLVDARTFVLGATNQARFDGFPLFGEALQGIFWRITGRPETASFVALLSVPGIAWFLRRTFGVPAHVAVIAFLAIPLVQIHATGSYVDLPANTWLTILGLIGFRQVVLREAPSVRTLIGASALAVATANTKFQLVPVTVVAALILVVMSLRADADRHARLLVIVFAMPFVFATPLKNLALHGNPVWPVELQVFGKSLPHLEGAYASSPVWLEHVPGPVRWAASVFELGLRPIASHARWSIDQWTPPSEPGYRMGGFFSGYVIVNLGALVLAAWVRRSRETNVALAFAGAAAIAASLMPQAHELRYYLFFMLLLVSLNLVLWSRAGASRLVTGLVATAALVIVGWSTGWGYLYASGDSFAELVAAKADRAAIARIPPGQRVCIVEQPWTFLYAPRFHGDQQFTVQEAAGAEECAGAPLLE